MCPDQEKTILALLIPLPQAEGDFGHFEVISCKQNIFFLLLQKKYFSSTN